MGNKLTLNTPELVSKDVSEEQLTFYAALASRRSGAAVDAIDTVIVANVSEEYQAKYKEWQEIDFVPFDPKNKRTDSILKGPRGKVRIVKGAVQVILELSANKTDVEERVMAANQSLAARGFRSLGVAMTNPNSNDLIFLGVLSLFDPPRGDTAATIKDANAKGIAVKMITGDQTAIAIETAKNINIGGADPKIYDMNALAACDGDQKDSMCRTADGFAEVMPEDKYNIVENLQHQSFTVGMTGDGVNDAPALKKAQIGIAVEGATDAARAAADIVLTEPGLSVIITAIITAREIFARVRNYVIYRIACTLQLVFFFFIGCLVFYPDQYYCTKDSANDVISGSAFNSCEGTEDFEDGSSSYPYYYPSAKYSFCIPVLGIVIITILNDGCMLTIARDHVVPSEEPQAWDLNKLRTVATVLGVIPLLSSLLMLYLGLRCADGLYPWYAKYIGEEVPSSYGDHYYLPYEKLTTMMYLKISISDFLTLFCARTRGPFYERFPSMPLFIAFMFATIVATIVAVNANIYDNTYPMSSISAKTALFVWIWNILFFFVQDFAKLGIYSLVDRLAWFREKPSVFDTLAEKSVKKKVEP